MRIYIYVCAYVGGRELGFPKACSVNPQPARIPRHRVQQGGTSELNHASAHIHTHTYTLTHTHTVDNSS